MKIILILPMAAFICCASADWKGHVFIQEISHEPVIYVAIENLDFDESGASFKFADIFELAETDILTAYCNGQKMSLRRDSTFLEHQLSRTVGPRRFWEGSARLEDIFSSACYEGNLAVVLTGANIIDAKAFLPISILEKNNCIGIDVAIAEASFEVEVSNNYARPVVIDPMLFCQSLDGRCEALLVQEFSSSEIVLQQIDLLVPGEVSIYALPGSIAALSESEICYRGLDVCGPVGSYCATHNVRDD